MDLKGKLDILKQAANVAQSKGALSIDDAVYVKKAFECIDTNTNLDIAVKILTNVAHIAQSKGCYSLKDAYIIYIALESIENDLNEIKTNEVPEEETQQEQ